MNPLAALALSAAIIAAAQNDVPHNGDNMVLVSYDGTVATAVDMDHQIKLPDGRMSVIVLLAFNPKKVEASDARGGIAGRVAISCSARTIQILSSYDLSKVDSSVIGQGEFDTAAKPIKQGANAEAVGNAVCGVVPSLPQSDKPSANARGQQVTEL